MGCYGFNTRCPAGMPPSVVAWVRGYVGTRLFEFSGLGDLGARCVGTWVRGYTTFQTFLAGGFGSAVRGYVGTWVHDFSNFPGREIRERGAWVRGYVGTRLFKLSWPGDLGGRCVSTLVRGYKDFKTIWAMCSWDLAAGGG